MGNFNPEIISDMRTRLFFGIIYSDPESLDRAVNWIRENCGIAHETPVIPFDYTDYYKEEMGWPLWRLWIATKRIILENELVEWKLKSIEKERELAVEGKRRVNLDPGGISKPRVVLVTTKNYSHRIYMGKGIFAEITLLFKKGGYHPLPWTYPDYASEFFIKFASHVRRLKDDKIY